MPQLPAPATSGDVWGNTLNTFLTTAHDNTAANGGKVKVGGILPNGNNNEVVAIINGQVAWSNLQNIISTLNIDSFTSVTELSSPAGAVMPFYRVNPPNGWLKANGAKYDTVQYPVLSSVIQGIDLIFTGVDPTTDTFATVLDHGLANGQALKFYSTSSLPAPLVAGTTYFVNLISGKTFKLLTSVVAVTDIDITNIGSGSIFFSIIAGGLNTTFNVPDLRGEFIRGFDDGRAVDVSRVLGSTQADEFKSHIHTSFATAADQFGSGGITGGSTNGIDGSSGTSATGGAETRPRNVALLYCIKY